MICGNLEASDASAALLAIEHFVYRIGLNAGMLAAALGGLDAFVFTAGIGENSLMIRSPRCRKARLARRHVVIRPQITRKIGHFSAREQGQTVCRADRRGIDDRTANALSLDGPSRLPT